MPNSNLRALAVCLPMLLAGLLPICATADNAQGPKRQKEDGIWLLIAVQESKSTYQQSVERTKAIIETRCRLLGIACKIERRPSDQPNRLWLSFSTRMALGRVKEILLAEGVEVRPILSSAFPDVLMEYSTRAEAELAKPVDAEVFPLVNVGTETYLIPERTRLLTGNDLRNCGYFTTPESSGKYEVNCRLERAGAARLKAWTTANIDRYIATIFSG